MNIAKLIKDLDNFSGSASLYNVFPPIEYDKPWDNSDPPSKTTDYVVVSSTIALFSGPETYIFPANNEGEIINWLELDGSYRGGLNHVVALNNAGYEVDND